MTTATASTTAPATSAEIAKLAAAHGLTLSGARPTLPRYIAQLWQRRHFVSAYANARMQATYSTAKLGQVWHLVTPLLNAAVYYFIFGIVLKASHGVPDYVPFLITGIFVWDFVSSSVNAGTRAVHSNLGLVRALHFPRASLPISTVVQLFQQLLVSMAALVILLLAFGQRPGAAWLLAVPALLLTALFAAGCAMIMARIGSKSPDVSQLMPFVLRTWMYSSGVMWSIDQMLGKNDLPHWVLTALKVNPPAVYIDLMRFALIDSFPAHALPHHVWLLAAGWALLAGVGGFIYFWKAEEAYGRG
ncbi:MULTISPECIES: ABC transporter permease [Streptomyces]|uniref:Transport permease protein n=1 Tax=Streptomyces virginiae TaxID=1961 RepID=A0ABQ3NX08_STRVG|nr:MULTISPECIES: ABC transporter permease [Streptomyces]MBP2344411.1 teichoic acid transport system permease protein [Streptomyces virginiae]MCI4081803.1 ABC transporter permease [Streptomyces sp. MMS21 TC-5]QNE27095.1 ABC transporter permease [Streptomyces sp. INR7]RST13059.1 ABC transporter permease [Streptomyces sp. WAC05950]GGQ14248.1 transport permease protein [Streptomyces virginiae]